MTSDEHETLAALEAENADLRSEVARLRSIAAERDALADEVAALQLRMLEKIRVAELERAVRQTMARESADRAMVAASERGECGTCGYAPCACDQQ